MNNNVKLLIWEMVGVLIVTWSISKGDSFILRKGPRHLITKDDRDYREDENIASLVNAKSRIDREEATNYTLAQLADQMAEINNRENEISISWDDNKISENLRPSDIPSTVKYNCENPFDILKLWQLLYNTNQSNQANNQNNQCFSNGLQSTTSSNSQSNNKQFDEQLPLSTSPSDPSQVDRPSSLNNRTEKSKPSECDSCQSVKNLPTQLPNIQYEQETPKASTKSNFQDFGKTAASQYFFNSCPTTFPQMSQNSIVQSTSDFPGILCGKSSYPDKIQPTIATSNANSINRDDLPTGPLYNTQTSTSIPSPLICQPSQQPSANLQERVIPIGGLPPNGIPPPTKLPPNTDNNKKNTTNYSIKPEIKMPNCCNADVPTISTSCPNNSCPKHLTLKNTKESESKNHFPVLNYIPLRPNDISGSLIQKLISKYKLKGNKYIDLLPVKQEPSLNYKLMQRQENVGVFAEHHNLPVRTFNNKIKTFFAKCPDTGNNRLHTNRYVYGRPFQFSIEGDPQIYNFRKYIGNQNRYKEPTENSLVERNKIDSPSTLDLEQQYRKETSYGFNNDDSDSRQQIYLSPARNSWKPLDHINNLEYKNYLLEKPINNGNSKLNVIIEKDEYPYEL